LEFGENREMTEGRASKHLHRVLIIDDNPSVLLSLRTFLEDNGYEALCASKTDEGFEMIRSQRPDLILLDIMMENLYSGFHICSSVKNDPELRNIPIIAISGIADRLGIHYSMETDREFFNPDAYLEKPIDRMMLLEKIQSLLPSS
jgi:CheY-like chemotaxis protein